MKTTDYFVLVTEHDTDQREFPNVKHGSNGSIVHECYLHSSALHQIVDRKKYIGDKYGKISIAKLVFLTDEEIKQLTGE